MAPTGTHSMTEVTTWVSGKMASSKARARWFGQTAISTKANGKTTCKKAPVSIATEMAKGTKATSKTIKCTAWVGTLGPTVSHMRVLGSTDSSMDEGFTPTPRA